ncbi:MAG: serine/threonine-protein kinase [Halioglobus sp.]
MRSVGSIVGRFRIEELLFQNNSTSLYRATDCANSALVALKLVNVRASGDQRAQERLLAEGSAASQLSHPNIVQLLEVGETDGQAYISMELVTQPTLAQHLKEHGCLSVPRALKITVDTALALQYAHNLGVVHRDIKPGNIFTDDRSTPAKLGDFGIASALHSARFARVDATEDMYATPRYMSPEQATGGRVDGRSDQYSLGAVLFEMLTGQAPHDGPNLTTLMTQIATEPTPPLRSLKPQLSRSLEQLVQRLMQKKPQKRFADCKELITALNRAETHSTSDG